MLQRMTERFVTDNLRFKLSVGETNDFCKKKKKFCLKEKCQLMAGQVNKHIAWTFFLFLCLEDNLKIS